MIDTVDATPQPDDLLVRLYRWSDLIAPLFQDGGLRVRPGSKMALTSELARPAILETFLSADLLTVHEHAEALRATLGSGVPHPRVPFTLLRTGIEAMATSLWLLTPTSRSERARRAILRAVASVRPEEQLRIIGGLQGPRETKRDIAMRDALQRLGLPAEGRELTTALKSARIGDVFADSADITLGVKRTAMWKIASGMAHNELWATIALSKPIADPEPDGTRVNNIAGDPELVGIAAGCVGLDAARVLTLAREQGAAFGDETAITEAIALFPNRELRERYQRRAQRWRSPRGRS